MVSRHSRTARSLTALSCAFALLLGTLTAAPLQAGMIGTEAALAAEARQDTLNRVQQRLAQDNVRSALLRLGADPASVDARVSSLSDAELAQLDSRLDTLPAGAGVIEVVGVVFVVLLVLELVGVTDIFTAI